MKRVKLKDRGFFYYFGHIYVSVILWQAGIISVAYLVKDPTLILSVLQAVAMLIGLIIPSTFAAAILSNRDRKC